MFTYIFDATHYFGTKSIYSSSSIIISYQSKPQKSVQLVVFSRIVLSFMYMYMIQTIRIHKQPNNATRLVGLTRRNIFLIKQKRSNIPIYKMNGRTSAILVVNDGFKKFKKLFPPKTKSVYQITTCKYCEIHIQIFDYTMASRQI